MLPLKSFSQQDYSDPLELDTDTQPEPLQVTPTTVGRAPVSEAEARRRVFEGYLDQLNARKQELKTIIAQAPTTPTELNVYYFIGRLNPPHEGHIETLKSLIEEAMRNNEVDGQPYKIIILLGSGPNGGERTLNDPLPFDLKMKVVIHLLEKKGIRCQQMINEGLIVIEEMGKAASQISNAVKKIVEIQQTIEEIHAYRYSGDKDEDVNKLAWIERSIQGNLAPLGLDVTTDVIGIKALKNEDDDEQSATQIRNDALIAFILDRETPGIGGFNKFNEKYNMLYREDTEEIYDSIIEQAKNLSTKETQEYIQHKTLPGKGKKAVKAKKGGRKTRRRKLRKTKRRRKLTKRRR
jgi:nicotinamide mononucleotide adenylyltransferase